MIILIAKIKAGALFSYNCFSVHFQQIWSNLFKWSKTVNCQSICLNSSTVQQHLHMHTCYNMHVKATKYVCIIKMDNLWLLSSGNANHIFLNLSTKYKNCTENICNWYCNIVSGLHRKWVMNKTCIGFISCDSSMHH